MPRVAIAAGGTAGHVVPALAVADALREAGADVFFIGARGRLEAELVPAAGYEVELLDVRGIDRGNPLKAAGAVALAARAVPAARRILRDRGAEAVMGGGGYVAGPGGLAALSLGLPLVLTEADRHLGLANRLLARRARRVCLAFEVPGLEGERFVVTGRPVPADILGADRGAARDRFGIDPAARCLLVFGGSQGARSINLAALEAFASGDSPRERGFHVLHIAGHRDYETARERLAEAGGVADYTLLEYEPGLADAARGLRPGPGPVGWLDLRAGSRRAARDPGPVSTCRGRPPAGERRVDARRGRGGGDRRRRPRRRSREFDRGRPPRRHRGAGRDGPSLGRAGPPRRRRAGGIGDPLRGEMSDLEGRALHFIAIGGAGMSALALVCHARGAAVTGSDRSESSYFKRVRAAGIDARLGHDADAVPPGADVVVSSAIGDDNPELRAAKERGQRVIHRGELLAELCAGRRLIAVAGAHGKTTTAGMLAWATLGKASFFLGGELPGAGPDGDAANAGWVEDAEWVIAEADESDASFLELRPEIAVITNVELDHHSRWSSRAELMEAFREFAGSASTLVMGAAPDLDPIAAGGRIVRFDANSPGPPLALSVPGEHNLLNARGALAALEAAGIGEGGSLAPDLERFPGMLRRLERKGSRDGAVIYDDYAHHPTEVAAALAALRGLAHRRLIAVFQPHLYSRTKALAERFGAALAVADEVGVLEVYPAREEPVGPLAGVSGLDVARAAADRAAGRPVWWLRDADTAERALAPRLREGDLLVTLGAGDVFRLADRLVGAEDGEARAWAILRASSATTRWSGSRPCAPGARPTCSRAPPRRRHWSSCSRGRTRRAWRSASSARAPTSSYRTRGSAGSC